MEDELVLKRGLNKGDSVILSTGATAAVRRSYPAGYAGEVEILLDGAEESERVSGLTLPTEESLNVGSELGDPAEAQQFGETRAPSRRMED